MIKAVLFDMDGVLIDAKEWHYQALNQVLDLFGMAIDRDAHLATFDGLSTRQKLEILTKTRGFPVGLHEFVNKLKQDRTVELATRLCRPTFHHRFALGRLRHQHTANFCDLRYAGGYTIGNKSVAAGMKSDSSILSDTEWIEEQTCGVKRLFSGGNTTYVDTRMVRKEFRQWLNNPSAELVDAGTIAE